MAVPTSNILSQNKLSTSYPSGTVGSVLSGTSLSPLLKGTFGLTNPSVTPATNSSPANYQGTAINPTTGAPVSSMLPYTPPQNPSVPSSTLSPKIASMSNLNNFYSNAASTTPVAGVISPSTLNPALGSPQISGLSASDQAAVNSAYNQGMGKNTGNTQTQTPSVVNQNGAGMGDNTTANSSNTTPVGTGNTQSTAPVGTFLVKNNADGTVSYMTPDQYNMNKDNFTMVNTPPDNSPGYGTQNADASSYQALVQQAANQAMKSANLQQGVTNAEINATQYGGSAPAQQATQAGLQQEYGAEITGEAQKAQALASLANATAPQLGAYGQNYYQPLNAGTNQGGVGGVTGPAAAGIVAGEQGAGQIYVQNQAILGKVSAQLPALEQQMNATGYNSNPISYMNQIIDWGKGNLSNSSIPEVQGSLNDIVASLSQVLGVPSSNVSDFRVQFANQIVNGLQSGQSIQQALQFAVNQATSGNQGYLQGAMNSTSNTGSSGTGNSVTSSLFGGNYIQDSTGKWVYKGQ
jgi:hypothetical protein